MSTPASSFHRWDLTPPEARQLQTTLVPKAVIGGGPSSVRTVAGLDVAAGRAGTIGRAVAVVLSFPELMELERSVVELRVPFPYVPGLLSFREAPLVLEAYAALDRRPDIVFVDGQGYANPRWLGLASHLVYGWACNNRMR